MHYAHLGRTGLQVSRIGFGCMTYGDPQWRPWTLDEEAARPHFRAAIEGGINFFDTADMYSNGRSEEVTGRILREHLAREDYVLATKVYFPTGKGPNRGGLSRKHVLSACDASLRRLGVDFIDLYQIHRWDPHTPIEETLSALDSLVQAGKVRYLGASSMAAWQLAKALHTSDSRGWSRFVAMQNHYNLVYREEEREMIPLCLD
ncbi:MAG: aldo/keto reductase, partial [Candidatus Eisenbacteria bacterium]|nr:aldo/keto reductase [Candidatus Latescibacterota bacterium]MBD3301331.1 aldo/keto reductase [Candidatus Eisenbacteria bacterium]